MGPSLDRCGQVILIVEQRKCVIGAVDDLDLDCSRRLVPFQSTPEHRVQIVESDIPFGENMQYVCATVLECHDVRFDLEQFVGGCIVALEPSLGLGEQDFRYASKIDFTA
jgi:hypothetical protein